MSVRLPFAPSDSMWHVVIDTLNTRDQCHSPIRIGAKKVPEVVSDLDPRAGFLSGYWMEATSCSLVFLNTSFLRVDCWPWSAFARCPSLPAGGAQSASERPRAQGLLGPRHRRPRRLHHDGE